MNVTSNRLEETVEDTVGNAIDDLSARLREDHGWSTVEANTLAQDMIAFARPRIRATEADIASYYAKDGTA